MKPLVVDEWIEIEGKSYKILHVYNSSFVVETEDGPRVVAIKEPLKLIQKVTKGADRKTQLGRRQHGRYK